MSSHLKNNCSQLHPLDNVFNRLLPSQKNESVMKKMLLIAALVGVLASCGNSNKSSTSSDTTNSITPPPTSDTTSNMAPMMGDTSKTDVDSLKK
jgi:hypothetical protein